MPRGGGAGGEMYYLEGIEDGEDEPDGREGFLGGHDEVEDVAVNAEDGEDDGKGGERIEGRVERRQGVSEQPIEEDEAHEKLGESEGPDEGVSDCKVFVSRNRNRTRLSLLRAVTMDWDTREMTHDAWNIISAE
ncbi:hypothetical protein C0993_006920 [Termitomyces sp. T159_Od127]|nr:hypothetical protein C0993_006920 [Termitomyces sp. T159_Od127]